MAESDDWAPPQVGSAAVEAPHVDPRTGTSQTGAILTLIFGAVGALSPFMVWIDTSKLTGDPVATSTSNSFSTAFRSAMRDASVFEHVGMLALVASLASLAIGSWLFRALQRGLVVSRAVVGVPVLVAGIVCLTAGSLAMEGIQTLIDSPGASTGLKPEDVMGLGMALAVLGGVGQLVMGIVLLSKRSMTGN